MFCHSNAGDYSFTNNNVSFGVWNVSNEQIVNEKFFRYLQDFNASQSTKPPSFWEILCFVVVIPFLFRYCQSLTYAIASKRAERAKNKEDQKK